MTRRTWSARWTRSGRSVSTVCSAAMVLDCLKMLRTLLACAALVSLAGCSSPDPSVSAGMTRAEAARRAEALRAVGARLFGDRSLSASGTLACASCHRPDRAFGPPDGRAVRLGGASNNVAGVRAVPSLRYLQAVPAFTEHYYAPADDGDESVDNGPAGGLTWDGRVDRGRDQARLPLLSPLEMADSSEAAVARK